jgi:protein phosphatase
MVKEGEIERREARFHPNKNFITRALGTAKQVEADFFEVEVKPGDTVLLCSDGLSNMMDDEDMMYMIRRYYDDIETAGKKLVEKANECGGKDNISLILIRV